MTFPGYSVLRLAFARLTRAKARQTEASKEAFKMRVRNTWLALRHGEMADTQWNGVPPRNNNRDVEPVTAK